MSPPLYCLAHRGGAGYAGENTLPAIRHSLAMGVDAIEIDVWLVKDQLVLTHDRWLPSLGNILKQDPAVLRQHPVKGGGTIPTLTEALELIGGSANVNIEIKGQHAANAIADTINDYCDKSGSNPDNYIVSSFDHHQLVTIKNRLPKVKRGVLIHGNPLDVSVSCEEIEPYSLHADINFINQRLIDEGHKHGLKVWVYTVNDMEDMAHLSAMGVDGVFSDYPEDVIAFNTGFSRSA